jgi:hypothetical protein
MTLFGLRDDPQAEQKMGTNPAVWRSVGIAGFFGE